MQTNNLRSQRNLSSREDESNSGSLARFAEALSALADDMSDALVPTWGALTGLQILFLRTIHRCDRVTRADLTNRCSTSRAAVTPGLSALLHKGLVIETMDGDEPVLSLGPAGLNLLAEIDLARVRWARRVLGAQSDLPLQDLEQAASTLEVLRRGDTRR